MGAVVLVVVSYHSGKKEVAVVVVVVVGSDRGYMPQCGDSGTLKNKGIVKINRMCYRSPGNRGRRQVPVRAFKYWLPSFMNSHKTKPTSFLVSCFSQCCSQYPPESGCP